MQSLSGKYKNAGDRDVAELFLKKRTSCALFKGRNLSIARLSIRSGLLSSLGEIHAWAYSGEISFFCGFPLS
jgi:hypothetical protein